jgi:hypothetical protein
MTFLKQKEFIMCRCPFCLSKCQKCDSRNVYIKLNYENHSSWDCDNEELNNLRFTKDEPEPEPSFCYIHCEDCGETSENEDLLTTLEDDLTKDKESLSWVEIECGKDNPKTGTHEQTYRKFYI